MRNDKMIRMAIIGIGNMGRTYAMNIADGLIEGMVLTAVCCRNKEGQVWAKERLGENITICSSTEELFAQKDLFDAVLIVTPHKTHPELTIKALELGYHVFCDKPAGVSAREAREMMEAGKNAGKAYAMMFHNRTMPIYARVKGLIESGELGQVLRGDYSNTKPHRTLCYHKSSPWRSSWNGEGGGLLINQGQHYLDLWQWFFGLPVNINGMIDYGHYNEITVDDNCTLFMKYENGMRGHFFSSTGEPAGQERIEIVGTKAKVIMTDHKLEIWKYSKSIGEYYEENTDPWGKLGCEYVVEEFEPCKTPYVVMLQNFADHILKGERLIADGQDGLNTLRLSNGAYLSSWLGTSIDYPLDEMLFDNLLRKKREKENF